MTAVAMLTATQNGTSGVLADSKHAGRRAIWAAPQAGSVQGQARSRMATQPDVE